MSGPAKVSRGAAAPVRPAAAPPRPPTRSLPRLRERLGVCQWFHYEDYDAVRRAVDLMGELGVRHVRTAISWADDHRPAGPEWHGWMMDQLRPFRVLLALWHTPPSISENGACSGPPREIEQYAHFVDSVCDRYGTAVGELELWNEPNNLYKWDFRRCDPGWKKFARMIELAAQQAHLRGRRTLLGGMMPVDPHWLQLMKRLGALRDIDIIGIHGFPNMWWEETPNWEWHRDWRGWEDKVTKAAAASDGRPVWITETGLATIDLSTGCTSRLELQQRMLCEAAAARAPRVYWYSLVDLAPHRSAIEGFHVDENEYHLGLVRCNGQRKPAFETMRLLLEAEDPQALVASERSSSRATRAGGASGRST